MTDKKATFVSFLLGLVIGNRVFPLFMHIIYWVIIILLILSHKLIG